MKPCRCCGRDGCARELDLGQQPVTNRFLTAQDEPEYRHRLTFRVCDFCGTAQLGHAAPAEEVRPRYDWIAYNEPEGHLDDLADALARLPGLPRTASVWGATYKDDSTLRRLAERGFVNGRPADVIADWKLPSDAGVESLQAAITPNSARRVVERHGQADLLIFRHALEHAHDIRTLLDGLKALVAPGGRIVFEVPDATRALERCDYSTLWEEHLFYFTPATLEACLRSGGFEVELCRRYPYTLEDSLVAVARPSDKVAVGEPPIREISRAAEFIERFDDEVAKHQAQLSRLSNSGSVALLGAGHLSATYLNVLGLTRYVDFVVDDSPHKQGLFMPGSRLPILPSSALIERDARLCLMSVRPEIEEAVIRKNAAFTSRGGRLASIFPDSPYTLGAV